MIRRVSCSFTVSPRLLDVLSGFGLVLCFGFVGLAFLFVVFVFVFALVVAFFVLDIQSFAHLSAFQQIEIS